MCGICGIVNLDDAPVEPQRVKNMMRLIKHRGPDDEGSFIDNNIGLGHVRLSIIDLTAAGHQPMFSQDKRYCIIYNGEVYNYLELKEELGGKYEFVTRTDTEVILNAFIEWGPECLHRFNGMFAFAVYDTLSRQLFIARDRYGIKPFYYYRDDKQLIFASELRALLPFLQEKKPNNRAIFEYLLYNRTDQGSYTFFDGIQKLPHGAYGVIKNGTLSIRKWYVLDKELKKPFASPEEFYETFKQSLTLHLRSDVPVGVCLSGGLDSSSIVSVLLREFNKTDLNTFSAVYKNEKMVDESEYINEYRTFLNNMFFTYPSAEGILTDLEEFIECQAEPVANLGPYAQLKVMQLAQKHVIVTLDGQGADEELAGYHYFFGVYFKQLLRQGRCSRLISETLAYFKQHHSTLAFKYLLFYLSPSYLKDFLSKISHNYITSQFYAMYRNNSEVKAYLYSPSTLNDSLIQHFEFKLEHLLKWEDHNSMWYSIESRVPFLDHNLVERTLRLPAESVIKKGNTKFILREAMKGILPEKIRKRRDKIGFATPWEKWCRTKAFRKLVNAILNSSQFRQRGYLNPNKCLNDYKLHLDGKINIAKEIWKWINLELWMQKFID